MAPDADRVVMVQAPASLSSVGQWYDDFTQTSDETVVELLARGSGGLENQRPQGSQ
jgi:predicted phosphoribosyltransferase